MGDRESNEDLGAGNENINDSLIWKPFIWNCPS